MIFTRTNFGGAALGRPDPYMITLSRLSDDKCVAYPAPCFGGKWINPNAGNREEGYAVFSLIDAGEVLRLVDKEGSDTQPDYSGSYAQYYDGNAPNDTTKPLVFTGTWRQESPSDTTIATPGSHTRTATFQLTKQ
jgi:hypothetical protein